MPAYEGRIGEERRDEEACDREREQQKRDEAYEDVAPALLRARIVRDAGQLLQTLRFLAFFWIVASVERISRACAVWGYRLRVSERKVFASVQ